MYSKVVESAMVFTASPYFYAETETIYHNISYRRTYHEK